jgi:hypothetical protein
MGVSYPPVLRPVLPEPPGDAPRTSPRPPVQAALHRAASRSSGTTVLCKGTVVLLCSTAEFYYTL